MNADSFQLLPEKVGGRLTGVAGNDHAADIQPFLLIYIDQSEYILIIGDAEVMPDLIPLDIGSIDGNDHFCLIGELKKHLQLTVRCKTRKNTGGMVIIQ